MGKLSVKTIVAIGIGAALFFVLSTYVSIPTPVPNVKASVQYPVAAVMAMLFGPLAGMLMAFIGHFLTDLIAGWGVWWSWVICSGVFGLIMGLAGMKVKLDDGVFGVKEAVVFNLAQIVAHLISWLLLAPTLDILIYSEPASKVFLQGITTSAVNIITTGILGTLLCIAYTKARPQKGSLRKEI